MLADLDSATLDRVLKLPSNSGVIPRITPSRKQLDSNLAKIRKQKWALSDEKLTFGIRSIAVPVHNIHGKTIAAINVTVNAAETTLKTYRKISAFINSDWLGHYE